MVGPSGPVTKGDMHVFQEVPVLPVVVPIAGVVVAVLAWRLHRRGRLTVPRVAVALAAGTYVAGVLANTVFPIFLDKPTSDARWLDHLNATPLVGYEVGDAVMNMGVFLPVGVLLALALPRASWLRALGVAAAFSLVIELTQLVTAHLLGGGHIADVNDLLFNVVGAGVGLLVVAGLSRVPVAARLTARFSWA